MKVLVVGGAGYVGGSVTDFLLARKHEVRVFDALLYEEAYRKPIEFINGDIRESGKLSPHLDWADAVIWLAALVGDGACSLNPGVSVAINQESVDWLAAHFDGRIVFMSTCSVYGAQDKLLDENSPVNPLSIYAVTKLAAEGFLQNKNAIIFRLGTLFGVGDLFSRIRLDLVVNTLTVHAHRHGQISVFGGDQFRPLLHVADAALAAVNNLESEVRGIFNLERQNVRILDLACQVRNHFPDLVIETTPIKFQDARNYRVSSEKARQAFGFWPSRSIDDGIGEIKRLIDGGRLSDVDNPRYANQAFLSRFSPHVRISSAGDAAGGGA